MMQLVLSIQLYKNISYTSRSQQIYEEKYHQSNPINIQYVHKNNSTHHNRINKIEKHTHTHVTKGNFCPDYKAN